VALRVPASRSACISMPHGGPSVEATWAERFPAHLSIFLYKGDGSSSPSPRPHSSPFPISCAPCAVSSCAAACRQDYFLRRSSVGSALRCSSFLLRQVLASSFSFFLEAYCLSRFCATARHCCSFLRRPLSSTPWGTSAAHPRSVWLDLVPSYLTVLCGRGRCIYFLFLFVFSYA
jgi:hypothetical protein